MSSHRLSSGRAIEAGIEARLNYADEIGEAAEPWSIRMDGRLRFNDRACSEPSGQPGCAARGRDADWRELYAARQFGGWRVALGWQMAVWGRADNLRVLDLVNPVDLRDFVLPDLNDYRRSVPMLKLNTTLGGWNAEVVYLPVFQPNRYPGHGTEFDLHLAGRFAAQGLRLLPERRPSRAPRNGEIGLLLSTSRYRVDWSLMALSTWNDDPVYGLGTVDEGGQPAVTLTPEYRRQAVLGGGLAVSLDGGWVARGEVTWSPDTAYTAFAAPSGIQRSATTTALAGLDYVWHDWLFSTQATDRWIESWRSDFLTPRRAALVTLSATGTTLSARLTTRITAAWMPQRGDGTWWQLKFIYKPGDDWAVETSVDWLAGRPDGFFGQFRDRDRVRLHIRRDF